MKSTRNSGLLWKFNTLEFLFKTQDLQIKVLRKLKKYFICGAEWRRLIDTGFLIYVWIQGCNINDASSFVRTYVDCGKGTIGAIRVCLSWYGASPLSKAISSSAFLQNILRSFQMLGCLNFNRFLSSAPPRIPLRLVDSWHSLFNVEYKESGNLLP